MNKDVIYIEPEDDITDIINKIEKAKEKIVALVPPKKAGVFRSLVNIKLIAKAGATAEKTVVLVTVDPSITKLAAATKIPVAKNLQSAPVIPETEAEESPTEQTIEDVSEPEEETTEEITEESAGTEDRDKENPDTDHDSAEEEEDAEGDEEEEEEEAKPAKRAKKTKKSKKLSGNKFLDWFKIHKKLAIFGGVIAVALIAFLVWAFGFAPAVDITVAIKTDSKNFSEGITFTDSLTSENAKEGKFYLEQKKIESVQEINFEATGKKNRGEKATGSVIVSHSFFDRGSIPISQGTVFTVNGLNYVATENVTLEWEGPGSSIQEMKNNIKTCANNAIDEEYCTIVKEVKVAAAEGGTAYNIPKTTSGWDTVVQVSVRSDNPMTGGTDDIITVVQQSDIEKAKNELTTTSEDENKAKLYETIGDDYLIIDGTFEQTTSSATATPAADQEVTAGTQPKLTVATTTSVYVINKNKLADFIKAKADLEEGQKVYDIKNIYIENFTNNGANSTAKLKAQYYIGPKITETEVVEKIMGKGLGDAQREIRDLYGVSDVRIDTSYPWVMAIPTDSNKVTVKFEIKDQDGNEVKAQNSDEKTDSENKNESKDTSSEENKTDEKNKE